MRERRQTVEHPFGTIKSWMGATHFQMKTLKNVGTEMALHVLAYNMKRVMQHSGRWWFDGGDPGIGPHRCQPPPTGLRVFTQAGPISDMTPRYH